MQGSDRCGAHAGLAHRYTMLDEHVIDQLVVMLRAGNYLPVSLAAVGVSRAAFYDWMSKGEADPVSLYGMFRERVTQARAEGEVRLVAQIARAATESWQAAGWLLERQYPARWGRTSVRLRDDTDDEDVTPAHEDPFAEVDELAARRRTRA